jgi:DNA-binding NarL/FixJ family response regulator
MPDEIRVPAGVAVYTKDELEQRARAARDAMAWGHSEWASASRAERKRAIVLLHGEGLSDGKIAARFGLTRQWVQRVRSGVVAALDESNGHRRRTS